MEERFTADEIVRFAVRVEENGKDFYSRVAEKTKQKDVKHIFEQLADDEARHKKIFEDFLSRIKNQNPEGSYPQEYFSYLKAVADGIIFTRGKQGEIMASDVESVQEALDIGIQVEKDSIHYYLEAKNIVSPDQKDIIEKIIQEERKHYMKLKSAGRFL